MIFLRTFKFFPTIIICALSALFNLSCSSYIQMMRLPSPLKAPPSPRPPQYCSQKQNLQMAHRSALANNIFLKHLKKIEKKHLLSFYDKATLFLFYQMLLRPEATHPSSRLQMIYGYQDKIFYKDSHALPGKKKMFWKTLEALLRENQNQRSLLQLAALADRFFPKNIFVTQELSQFIQDHESLLKKDPSLANIFFKVEEPLRPGESFPSFSLSRLVPSSSLSQASPPSPLGAQDFPPCPHSQQTNSSFFPSKGISTNAFALYERQGYFLVATTSTQVPKDSQKLPPFPRPKLFPPSPLPFPCLFVCFPSKKRERKAGRWPSWQ